MSSTSHSPLPADFYRVFAAAVRDGVLDEPSRSVERRAVGAIAEAARAAGILDGADLTSTAQWAERLLAQLEGALHMELCRSNGAGLKPEYNDMIEHALTREGIADLAAVVLRLAQAISPGLAVSTVALYVAVWLLKIGLNRWCAVAVETPDGPRSRPRSGTPTRRGRRGRRAA